MSILKFNKFPIYVKPKKNSAHYKCFIMFLLPQQTDYMEVSLSSVAFGWTTSEFLLQFEWNMKHFSASCPQVLQRSYPTHGGF